MGCGGCNGCNNPCGSKTSAPVEYDIGLLSEKQVSVISNLFEKFMESKGEAGSSDYQIFEMNVQSANGKQTYTVGMFNPKTEAEQFFSFQI